MDIIRKLLIVLLAFPMTLMAQIKTVEVELVVDGDQRARPWLQQNENLMYYILDAEYPSGTELRFVNREVAYSWVCLVVSDRHQMDMTVVYNGRMVTRIPQQQSLVLDDVRGREYMCLLFSNSPIDTEQLEMRYSQSRGNFYQRMERALGAERVEIGAVRYVQNLLGFSCRQQGLVPLYIELEHK